MEKYIIENGIHYLSGTGYTTIERWSDTVDVDLFCIDGVTYGVFIDPDDGYRSYDSIETMDNIKCQYTFPSQPVIVKNEKIEGDPHELYDSYDGWEDYICKSFIRVLDAVNHKEVLVVGTDYSMDYYPCAIFNYTPENLEINKNR